MMKVLILGLGSSGKTTLVKTLSQELRNRNYRVAVVSEGARHLANVVELHSGKPSYLVGSQDEFTAYTWQLSLFVSRLFAIRTAELENSDFIIMDRSAWDYVAYANFFGVKGFEYTLVGSKTIEDWIPQIEAEPRKIFLLERGTHENDGFRLMNDEPWERALEIYKQVGYFQEASFVPWKPLEVRLSIILNELSL